MKDTVFSPSFGNRPTQLVGRQAEVDIVAEALTERPGSRQRSTVLLGQRGSGKTVLLWELADRARSLGFVVATPTIASPGMLDRIVEKVQDSGERFASGKKTRISGGSIGALGFSAGLQFTREVQETKSSQYKLTQLCRKLNDQGHGVLVLVDELQADDPDVRQLVSVYQELVGEGLNVALVMAGLPGAVSGILNDRVLTFLNRACKIELAPLATGDVDAYYAQAFEQMGLQVPAELRREAAQATMGSPYLLQLVGHNITAYTAEDGIVDKKILQEALETARADFERDICETTLAALSGRDVDFLRAMAHTGSPARMADIAQDMGVSQDYAQKYRKRLLDAGIVEQAGRGRLRFAVPYLVEYLRQSA